MKRLPLALALTLVSACCQRQGAMTSLSVTPVREALPWARESSTAPPAPLAITS